MKWRVLVDINNPYEMNYFFDIMTKNKSLVIFHFSELFWFTYQNGSIISSVDTEREMKEKLINAFCIVTESPVSFGDYCFKRFKSVQQIYDFFNERMKETNKTLLEFNLLEIEIVVRGDKVFGGVFE